MDLVALEKQLRSLQTDAATRVAAVASTAELDELGSSLLGKRGAITEILRGIGALPTEDRPKIGVVANEVRAAIDAFVRDRRVALSAGELRDRIERERVDVTTPGPAPRLGSLHPIPETIAAISEIMSTFGFVVAEGQEIEDDVTNFQLLNIPEDHPSRDLWDTLYLQRDSCRFEGDSRRVGKGPLRRCCSNPIPTRVLPVHRALRRRRRLVAREQGRLDDDSRGRDGASSGPREWWH
ncbi:MAG: hypothetical protein EBS70_08060 [Actinobacteria bacterium]|nr:hypothetical protein [Actinomycetota bacterium]